MNTKEQIVEKLKELGIITENCYPKKTYLREGEPTVGLFAGEMKDDFFFYSNFDKAIYKLPKTNGFEKIYEKEEFQGKEKYQIPLIDCEVVWEDRPYQELPDMQYNQMTLRQYACIQLGVAKTGIDWLDGIIKESNNLLKS